MNVTSSCRLKKERTYNIIQTFDHYGQLQKTLIVFFSYPIKKTYIACYYGIAKLINVMTANIISKVKHTDAFINTNLLR